MRHRICSQSLDRILTAFAVEYNPIFLGYRDGAGGIERVWGGVLELDVGLLRKHGSASPDGEISEPWSFDSDDLELAAKFAEDTSRECVAIDVICDDDNKPTCLGSDFQRWEKEGDLLFPEDEGVFEFDFL
jgi:hypothetical protein